MKVKIVFFDCDGVLLFGEPWEKFSQEALIPKELDTKWWNDYYDKKITFDEWMELERQAYRKAKIDRKVVEKIFGPRNDQINKEAEKLTDYLKSKQIESAIISSGAEAYVSAAAKYLGIKYYHYNSVFEYDKNDKLFNIKTFGPDPEMKVKHIIEVCNMLDVAPQESIFVGDSTNDYKAFELTGRGIMYGNHPQLAKYAWKQVNDLTDIIKIVKEENEN